MTTCVIFFFKDRDFLCIPAVGLPGDVCTTKPGSYVLFNYQISSQQACLTNY